MQIDPATHIGWCDPRLEKRLTPLTGNGLFATAPIRKGEVLSVWGGYVVTTEERNAMPFEEEQYVIQVDENHHLATGNLQNIADYVNHSCDPTGGLRGQIVLVAMRDIAVGEEITFDYAMTEAYAPFEMDCACGTPHCRKHITANDWQLPELQERYKGYFSTYVQSLIDSQHSR